MQKVLFLFSRSLFRCFVRREAEVLQLSIFAEDKGHNYDFFFGEACDIGYLICLVIALKAEKFSLVDCIMKLHT